MKWYAMNGDDLISVDNITNVGEDDLNAEILSDGSIKAWVRVGNDQKRDWYTNDVLAIRERLDDAEENLQGLIAGRERAIANLASYEERVAKLRSLLNERAQDAQ